MNKGKKEVTLSRRLRALADMVTPGNVAVDVGCDHGFLSIFLVQKGISPRVIAMDVRTGPLSRAKEHIAEAELTEYIETRLSDGLSSYKKGEAQTLICAGMGGKLMQKILREGGEKTEAFRELILQPQSELTEFRRFLRESGYHICEENILREENKYYFLMKVSCGERIPSVSDSRNKKGVIALQRPEAQQKLPDEKQQGEKMQDMELQDEELWDRYGRTLLQGRHPVLKAFLEDALRTASQIKTELAKSPGERAAERRLELEREIEMLHRALAFYECE